MTLAEDLRQRKAALEQKAPPSDGKRDLPPPAPPKPKKTLKPKAEDSDFSAYVKEIAAATGIPEKVLLSPNSNHIPICSPSELDQRLREKYQIPASVGEKLDKFGVTDPDELAFLKRYARNRKDFQIYYQLLCRGSVL
jgi:hypothetical protein